MKPRMCISDLHPRAWLELKARMQRPGINLVQQDHVNGFGGSVHFARGTLYHQPDSSIETLTHEAGHAMLLPLRAKARMNHPRGDFDSQKAVVLDVEHYVMVIQTELVRRIPDLGVLWALEEMESCGYTFGMGPFFERGALTWWRRQETYHIRDHLEALGILTALTPTL